MTLEFAPPLVVEGHVRVGDKKVSSRVPVMGLSWLAIPSTGWQYAARKAKALLHSAGAICEFCAGLSISEGPCPTKCSPVRLIIWTGEQEYPLTDDLLTTYAPGDRLRLIATTPADRLLYATLEVSAAEWVSAEPERRHTLMQDVVNQLKRGALGDATPGIRAFIWDGEREIPYPVNWAKASADQGR